MPDIKCPNCGTVFSVDDTTYASISKQVRDKEFEKELTTQKTAAVKLIEAEKNQLITELQAQISSFETEKALAVRTAVDGKLQEISEKENRIIELQAQLYNQKQTADSEKAAAVQLAEAKKDKTLIALQGKYAAMESEYARKEAELIADRDRLLQIKDEVVAVNNNETLPTVLDTMKTVVLQQAYESDESIEDILKDAQATAEAEAG